MAAQSIRDRIWSHAVKLQPAPDGKPHRDERPVRLLKPKEHTNRNCSPRTKRYEVGDTIAVDWLNEWRLRDGMRSLGSATEGVDFEFVS